VSEVRRADVCVVACAEAWRGDGEILASPMGTIPTLGARLAALTFEPDLVISDGEAMLVASPLPLTGSDRKVVEGWLPYRNVFDVVWSGRRHVMMGASQINCYGDTNISAIGDPARPTAQLLGVRGAPGNTANHPTSYWIPRHSTRVFVSTVDMVSGIGGQRAAELGLPNPVRRVVSELAVLDVDPGTGRLRLASVHPGVTVEDVLAKTGFELVCPAHVPATRLPTAEELATLAELDPGEARYREVPA
jgi:acyl CoA:acetate/3-ketoacid CoA transferase beta subunit